MTLTLSELRKRQNLTQQELADLIGVNPNTIRKWERISTCDHSFFHAAKLQLILGCDAEQLLAALNEQIKLNQKKIENTDSTNHSLQTTMVKHQY